MHPIGVIGLGKMGMPIARNLIERGFDVVGYRRHGSPELKKAGGISVSSPAEVAEVAEIIVSILPDAAAVQQVVCGPAGTLTTLRPGTVHIEMSTIDISDKLRIRDSVVARGGDLLDCPISGSPGMVEPRLATTFVSGEPAAIDTVRPVLDAIGPWVYTGKFGSGATMKYISNLLIAVHTVATAEALVLASRSGLDLDLVQETIGSSLGSSAIWRQRGPVMQRREWIPAPGPVATLHSILQQIEKHAAGLGVDVPLFASAKAVFDQAVSDGWDALDIACVYDQVAGLPALSVDRPA